MRVLLMSHSPEAAISPSRYLIHLLLSPFPSHFHPGETSSTWSSRAVWRRHQNCNICILMLCIFFEIYVLYNTLIGCSSKYSIARYSVEGDPQYYKILPLTTGAEFSLRLMWAPPQSSLSTEAYGLQISRGYRWFHQREVSSVVVNF